MDGQCKFKTVFRSRIIIRIRRHFIADLLDRKILRGDNGKSAAVEQIVGLSFGISLLIFQVFDDVFDQRICEVGVRRLVLCDRRCLQNTVIHVIGHGLIVLRLINISLLEHIAEYGSAPLRIFLRILDRVKPGRVLGDRGDDRTFGEGQVRRIFVEVTGGGRLYAEAALSQVDGVHIRFQDLILGHLFFKLKGEILLLQLTLDFVKPFFIDEIGEDIVLDQLLGQRTGAF